MSSAPHESEVVLNGLHPAKLIDICESIKKPEVQEAVSGPWKSRVVWQNGFRTKAYMRKHAIEMDEPGDLDASDQAASAHEQLLSAIGSCLTVGFVLNATKQNIRIHDLEIALEAHFDDIRKWAGSSPNGNPGYRGITAKIFVRADADNDKLRELWKLAVDGSPVTQSVMRGTPVHTEFGEI